MTNLINYLKGKKTYIVGLLFVVYGALVYFKVPGVPGPQEVGAAFVGIGLLAGTARSAFSTEINKIISGSAVPVIDPAQLADLEGEFKIVQAAVAHLLSTPKAVEPVVVTPLTQSLFTPTPTPPVSPIA